MVPRRQRLALLLGVAVALLPEASSDPDTAIVVPCDIVVAGGSAASLAAAITAAEADHSVTVCFTEITDWPGGQMASGGVPAIDYGSQNQYPANQPKSFRDLVAWIDRAGVNPGACSVSLTCYEPNWWVAGWVMPRLAKSANLKVFLRTAVTGTQRDAASGAVTSITAVQRTPRANYSEYSEVLSATVTDWYSPADSPRFTKQVVTLTGKVFIEATEFADVLVTGKLNWTQGAEVPTEMDVATLDQCGQVWTTTFYMGLLPTAPAKPDPAPAGGDAGIPFPTPWTEADWYHSWTWRRAFCADNRSLTAANVGDVTQQNLGNDLDSGYPPLPSASVRAQAASGAWAGGLNNTVMQMLEERSYGYYRFMQQYAPDIPSQPPVGARMVLNRTVSGSGHGLSKLPYNRDTRRPFGLDGFRLYYRGTMDYYNESEPRVGFHFQDTIALSNYNDDCHHLHTCTYPAYMVNHTTKPFYIPFRALTVQDSPNLLVAGKTMSQSFHANGATRLHPSEWTSGVAAGGTAVLMLHRGWTTTREAYDNVNDVRAFLNSSVVGQPLQWALGALPPPSIGTMCAWQKCIGTDHRIPGHAVYNSTTCDAQCAPLLPNEWLANADFWTVSSTNPGFIESKQATLLKKSLANSGVLPPSQVKAVPAHTLCRLVDSGAPEFAGYYLCSV